MDDTALGEAEDTGATAGADELRDGLGDGEVVRGGGGVGLEEVRVIIRAIVSVIRDGLEDVVDRVVAWTVAALGGSKLL